MRGGQVSDEAPFPGCVSFRSGALCARPDEIYPHDLHNLAAPASRKPRQKPIIADKEISSVGVLRKVRCQHERLADCRQSRAGRRGGTVMKKIARPPISARAIRENNIGACAKGVCNQPNKRIKGVRPFVMRDDQVARRIEVGNREVAQP